MSDSERLQEIMGNFNQDAAYGSFPMSPKDFYFVMQLVLKLLPQGETETRSDSTPVYFSNAETTEEV